MCKTLSRNMRDEDRDEAVVSKSVVLLNAEHIELDAAARSDRHRLDRFTTVFSVSKSGNVSSSKATVIGSR